MRISDSSSDVCSSALRRARPVRADPGHRRLGADALRIFAIFDWATVARLARAVIARLGHDLGRGAVVVEMDDNGILILAAILERLDDAADALVHDLEDRKSVV